MYRGTINIEIKLVVFSCVAGPLVVGTLLGLYLSTALPVNWGVVKLRSVMHSFFSISMKIWSRRKPYSCLSPFPACFNMALWPSGYEESCACERAVSEGDGRGVGQIQGDLVCRAHTLPWLTSVHLPLTSIGTSCSCVIMWLQVSGAKILHSPGAKYHSQDANRGTKPAQGRCLSP